MKERKRCNQTKGRKRETKEINKCNFENNDDTKVQFIQCFCCLSIFLFSTLSR